VRYLPGQGPLENAIDEARVLPLDLAAEVMERRSDYYPVFVALAGHLQVIMGARPILLPVEKVGPLLGVKPMTVSRYRECAIEDGYLREVTPAVFRAKGKRGRATEFVFNVSRFAILQQRAAPGTVELFQSAKREGQPT
jgi:hypothetical protein